MPTVEVADSGPENIIFIANDAFDSDKMYISILYEVCSEILMMKV